MLSNELLLAVADAVEALNFSHCVWCSGDLMTSDTRGVDSIHSQLSSHCTICVSIAQPVFRKDCSLLPRPGGVVGWERSGCLVRSSLRHIQYGMSVGHVQPITPRISGSCVICLAQIPCAAVSLLDCYKFIKTSISLLMVLHVIEECVV